jgi:hypothetical protein
MIGSTITTTISHSITLGLDGYTSPLFVAGGGEIDGSRGSVAALYVPLLGAPAEVDNAGVILGAAGRIGITGQNGAAGVYFADSGTITNTGEIAGGQGGRGAPKPDGDIKSGNGGIGVQITAAGAVFDNKGNIYGGAGGPVGYPTDPSRSIGAGGYGVEIGAGATLRNSGNITGGAGGLADQKDENFDPGSYGGEAVHDRQGLLVNSGTILGGDGGYGGATAIYIGGAGAIGRNTGQIIGGSAKTNQGAGGPDHFNGYGLSADDDATFWNSGSITGGIGRFGVVLSNATLINDGLVQAGYSGGFTNYLPGAAGVEFQSGLLVNNGTIIGALSNDTGPNPVAVRGGISGGDGVFAQQGFTNHGKIIGGNGGSGEGGGYGGDGILIVSASRSAGLIRNSGIITGGAGGYDSRQRGDYAEGGSGGFGANLQTASLFNTGTISGGAGGAGDHAPVGGAGSQAGLGGSGIWTTDSSIINRGVISGGPGGVGANGGGGGAGATLSDTTLSNAGLIVGGEGGTPDGSNGIFKTNQEGDGGIGVRLWDADTLINSGTISGGAGGVGSASTGAAGDAVYLYLDSTLIIDPGAVFNGQVVADPIGGNTLELSGKSSSALTGIGTKFTGFATLAFAPDSAWTLSGTSAAIATGEEITGFTNVDAITLTDAAAASGSVTVANAGTVTIDAGDATYRLRIAGTNVGETDFRFLDDTLTKIGGAEMKFLAPAPAMAVNADFSAVFFGPARAADLFPSLSASSIPADERLVRGVARLLPGVEQHPVLPGFTLHA